MTGDEAMLAVTPRIVVMGVSASGKSTVAEQLARRFRVPWIDADDLHPRANVEKMSAGQPLTDSDRWPWLDTVGKRLGDRDTERGMIVACSALRRSYRDRIRGHAPSARFLHLAGTPELLLSRANARADHYMPVSLLSSQLATLEPLEADEAGLTLDVDSTLEFLVSAAFDWILRKQTSMSEDID